MKLASFRPTKYSREKVSEPRNSGEKTIGTPEIPTRKVWDPQSTRKGTTAQ